MALVQSPWATGRKPMPSPIGSEVINVLLSADVTAAQTADGDIIAMGYLPEDCVLVDAVYAASDLDTNGSPAHAMSFGVINSDKDGLTTALETGIDVGQAGTAARLTPTTTTLTTKGGTGGVLLGYEVTTSAATGAAGTVHLSLSYRAVAHDA